ncbi:MAG TPA: ATP-binding protein [Vicinamibacterales bacterium]
MRRRIGLRWIAAALVLVIVAPLGLFAGLSIQRAWRRQLANVDNQNIATVRAISIAVDQALEKTTAALDVLGELHALDGPDLPAFESLAARILPYQPNWTSIILASPTGKILDGIPDGADGSLTESEADWARATAANRKTTVSSIRKVPGTQGWMVMVGTPVIRHGVVTAILGARVRSDALSALLRQQQAPPTAIVTLLDGESRIMARTQGEATFRGTAATQAFMEAQSRMGQGAWRGPMRDGRPSYAAFSRSPLSGLTVALALPAEEVDGPIRRILWLLGAAWIVVLTLGAGLGLLLGQVIVRAMSSASSAAMALARGDAVSLSSSRIAEVDELAAGLRHASETLQARNRERDEASRLKDEFLMTISHELRTPLTAICGWARMLSTGQIRDEQRGKAVDAIERNAQALQQIVDDLLDVSRVVSGKLRLDVQPLAMADVVASAIEAIRPAADAKGILVTTDLSEDGSLISGDRGRLQQVLWNLLSNAVKFTPNGGRIDIECRRAGAHVELLVRDTGVGIEPEFLPHVFERFRQGKGGTTRAHGGLGLGLSIVRHFVELHGGTVTGENNVPPPGATFRVVLPAPPASTYPDVVEWSPRGTATATKTPTTAAR